MPGLGISPGRAWRCGVTWTTSPPLDGASKDKTFRRNVIIYAVASGMGGLVHLAHLLWTHLLNQADYGRFAILEGVVFGLAASTVTLAPQQYILVYVHKKPRLQLAGELGGLLVLALIVGGITALAVLGAPDLLLPFESEGLPRWSIAGVVVAAALATGRMMAQSLNETLNQPTRAALWSDFVDGTRPFIALSLFFALDWKWEARWGGLVLAQGGAGIAAIWILSRRGWLGRPASWSELQDPLRFSIPMIFAMLAYVGYQTADRLYVALWTGIEAAGRYEAAYRVALLVNTVNLVTLKSFTPLFYSAFGRGNQQSALALLRKTSLRAALFVVALVVLLPALVFYTPLLEESYRSSTQLLLSIPILCMGLGLLGISFLWQTPLLANGQSRTVSVIAVGAALGNLAADALLVPSMGELGAALGTLLAFAFMLAATVVATRRTLAVRAS
jgi:O-antigen/teichoic acid export membrane protein